MPLFGKLRKDGSFSDQAKERKNSITKRLSFPLRKSSKTTDLQSVTGPPPAPIPKQSVNEGSETSILRRMDTTELFAYEEEAIKKMAGVDLMSLESRLKLFYSVYEPDKKQTAIDSIVDWTFSNGDEELNRLLLKRYGANLDTLAREQFLAAKAHSKNHRPPAEKRFVAKPPITPKSASQPDVRPKQRENGRENKAATTHRRKRGQNKQKSSDHRIPGRADATVNGKNVMSIDLTHRRVEKVTKVSLTIHSLLSAFYLKHDRSKLNEDTFETILEWTDKYGIDALNKKLRTKYGEDLEAFRSEGIRRENLKMLLKMFYDKYEPGKPHQQIDLILNWALQNGTSKLNAKLAVKYGEDLNDMVSNIAKQGKSPTTQNFKPRSASNLDDASIKPPMPPKGFPAPPKPNPPPTPSGPPRKKGERPAKPPAKRPPGKPPLPNEPAPSFSCRFFEPDDSNPGYCVCGMKEESHQNRTNAPRQRMTMRIQKRLEKARLSNNIPRSKMACQNYEMDLSETGFGFCKCGHPRSEHTLNKQAGKPKGLPNKLMEVV